MCNNLLITAVSSFDSSELIDLEDESAITKYRLNDVCKVEVEDENEGLDLSTFSSLSLNKRIDCAIPLFYDFDEGDIDIECEICFENISPIFNELEGVINVDSKNHGVKISSLNNAQKDMIREYLEVINKITYKGVKLANLDIDYIIECGYILVTPND